MSDLSYLDRVRYPQDLNDLERLSLINLSYSRLNTILDKTWGCGLKYYYQYVLKYPDQSGPHALLGNIIHEVLELCIDNDKEYDEVDYFATFEVSQKKFDPENTIPADLIYKGKQMLQKYYNKHKKDKYSARISLYPTILGKELPFEIVIGNGKFRGFIDLVYEMDGVVTVCDYKSGATEVPDKYVPTNTQLGIYALAMKKAYPDKKIIASLSYLQSEKVKAHEFTDEDLEGILETLEGQVADLVGLFHFKPTTNERTCYNCTYAQNGLCPTGKSRLKRKRW